MQASLLPPHASKPVTVLLLARAQHRARLTGRAPLEELVRAKKHWGGTALLLHTASSAGDRWLMGDFPLQMFGSVHDGD